MPDTKAERERFEKWLNINFSASFPDIARRGLGGMYLEQQVNRLWIAWQAGRASAFEEAAQRAESFKGEVPATDWPPLGLVKADRRFDNGVSEKAADMIAAAIRQMGER